MNFRRGRFVVSALFLSLTTPLWPCSPMGPETVLNQPGWPLRPPIPNFRSEIRLITPPSMPPAAAAPQTDPSFAFPTAGDDSALGDAEYAELQEILRDLPPERLSAARDSYSNRRLLDHPLSEDLPLDIRFYIEGARLLDQDKSAEAIEIWKRLLDLPANERQNRSTWAAWMIARTLRKSGGAAAAQPWYALCSRLAGEDYRDCLKLGLSSLGWQARYALDQGDYRTALELYYHQALAGDPTGWDSIRRATPPLEKLSDAQLRQFAADPFLRGLITTELVNQSFDFTAPTQSDHHFTQDVTQRWLSALESVNLDTLAEAPRFAELAYSSANFSLAERWLKKAPPNDSVALWLRGKIALMYGRTEEAENLLKQAVKAHPRDLATENPIYQEGLLTNSFASDLDDYRVNQLYGDLGATELAQKQYFSSLTALYQGSFYQDAHYLSERVLSSEELIAYTRANFPEPSSEVKNQVELLAESARLLLARRLAREGRYEEAQLFFPKSLRPLFGHYLALRKKAATFSILKNTRESALWEAAQIHIQMGDSFFGTWSKQSDFTPGKTFLRDYYLTSRLGIQNPDEPIEESQQELESSDAILPRPTTDEINRVLRNNAPYEKKAHYRYVAADLAWEAAQFMPNGSEETARVLGIAGLWLKVPDPKAADRFYKAMIWRNWSTPLAREADAKRWFPEISWSYDP